MSYYYKSWSPYNKLQPDDVQGLLRFSRNDFETAGQRSFDNPPSEDPEAFEQLLNVLPVTRGTLQRRWGYGSFYATADVWQNGFEYQSDMDLARQLILTGGTKVVSLDEDGAVVNSAIYTPTQTPFMTLS